jgi:hypothetical protein
MRLLRVELCPIVDRIVYVYFEDQHAGGEGGKQWLLTLIP